MRLSTHYYVLVLSEQKNKLYECFRDELIDVQNQAFPVEASAIVGPADEGGEEDRLRELLRAVDQRFAHYYTQDPLNLIVAGEQRLRSTFASVTAHGDIIIGGVDGDHTATSPRDLGQIVWPMVKEAMSGLKDNALYDLEAAEKAKKLVVGLEAVGRYSDLRVGSTLLVEEDYRAKGNLRRRDRTVVLSPEVDVRDVIDDLVDAVIESVLEIGGRVVFMRTGSLTRQKKIALILSGAEEL